MTAEEISNLLKTIHDIRQDTLITEFTVLLLTVILAVFSLLYYLRRM
jgi:hypothetical protein